MCQDHREIAWVRAAIRKQTVVASRIRKAPILALAADNCRHLVRPSAGGAAPFVVMDPPGGESVHTPGGQASRAVTLHASACL